MYARVMTFQIRDFPAAAAKLDGLSQTARLVPGLISIHVIWSNDGVGVVTSVYDDADATEKASSHGLAMWAEVMPHLVEPPKILGYPNARIIR